MPKLLTLCPMATWTVRKSNPVNTANINQMPPLFWQGRHFIFGASPHNSRLTAQAPLRRLWHGICVAKMLDNVGLRYPHRASGTKAPRTLRPLPLLRFAVSATGGAHLCSIQYYLRFWLSSCRTSLAVSILRIMRYCLCFQIHLRQTMSESYRPQSRTRSDRIHSPQRRASAKSSGCLPAGPSCSPHGPTSGMPKCPLHRSWG